MDKAIFLQKQVRENSEDFQNTFRDLVAWEEEMKRKDFEIRNAKDDQELPPVRSKKKKKAVSTSETSNDEKEQSKEKKIAGSDYKSWDKFDADKACKEIDEKKSSKDKEELEFEIPSKEELEKEHAEATKYKNEGNVLVQKKEYAKAVGKYSQAIKMFSGDAVFYANRALCQLKLDNLYAADADCTQAIKLDDKYIKAYHRRATARMELKRYKDAKKDFEKILELEPNNKEAAIKLKQVEEKINKSSKPIILAGENDNKNSIEKAIGKKLFEKNKNKITESQPGTSKEKLIIEEIDSTDNEHSAVKDKNHQDSKNVNFKKLGEKIGVEDLNKDITNKKASNAQKEKTIEDELPPWLPKLKEGLTIVQPIADTPYKSNKNLKRIKVTEIAEDESIFGDIVEEKFIEKKPINKSSSTSENIKNEHKEDTEGKNKNTQEIENLPPPPKTSVGFFMSWRKSVSNDFRYKYLKQIVPKTLPGIIKASMEHNVLSDILSILSSKFVPNGDNVYDWLLYLSKLERFRALSLFMTPADKKAVNNLIEYCKNKEGKSDEEVNNLRAAYEL